MAPLEGGAVAPWDWEGLPLLEPAVRKRRRKAVEKTVAAPPWKTLRVSHFSTATTTTGSRSWIWKADTSRATKTGHLHVLTTY